MTLYVGIVAYAIIRHQLMDIEVIIKKTLVFAGLLTSVFAILILPTLIIQEYLFRGAGAGGKIAGLVISGAIIILTMRRIETFLINITDKYLFQKKYDYKELLRAFTDEVLTILDPKVLLDTAATKLRHIIKIESVSVKLLNYNNKEDMPATRSKVPVRELILPLKLHSESIGVLRLGKKKSDEDYTQDDLDILLPLAQALGIAISNAKLFKELEKTQAEVAQKEKMATIGTLAAGMAHEIRNPITTIRTFADYLPDKYMDSEFMAKFNRLIPHEIERIDDIARSLLEFSHAPEDSAKMEEVNLEDAINVVLLLLKTQYKFSDINVFVRAKGKMVILSNKTQVQDIFFNIMKYVLTETPGNSEVAVNIEWDSQNMLIRINDKKLVVADYIIKGVFEPLSGPYKERRGFGFELFVAKQLIEKNSGAFQISSDRENGTEFIINFKNASLQPL